MRMIKKGAKHKDAMKDEYGDKMMYGQDHKGAKKGKKDMRRMKKGRK